jgi:hypothetical protein
MRLSTNDEHCDARNNILYVTTPGSELAMLDATGVLDLSHNWIKPGWVGAFGGLSGVINNDGTQILGSSPGFANEAAQDFTLTSGSACVDAATALHPTVAVDGAVTRQYVKHQSSMTRTIAGTAAEVGAFEQVPLCAADIDCDNDCDEADVAAFVLALIDADAFALAYPGCPVQSADLNQDTNVNALDIPAFIAELISGPTP